MSDAPVPQEIIFQIGPTLVASLISYTLLGISIMQIYLYHLNFTHDQTWLKTLVYTVFVLDIFQSVVAAEECWHGLVTGWGRPNDLLFPGWSFVALPIVSGAVALMVQVFYAWRIYLVGKWKIIPAVIVFFGTASCAAACAIGFGFIAVGDVRLLHVTNMTARTYIWLGGAVLTDVIISASMLYLLYGARQSKFGHTQRMANRLIKLTIETGLVTATTATLELILFLTLPSTNSMHLLGALNLCKVYSNALFTSLNSRATGSRNFTAAGSRDTTVQWNSVTSPRAFDSNISGSTVVHIETEMDRFEDRGGKPKKQDYE